MWHCWQVTAVFKGAHGCLICTPLTHASPPRHSKCPPPPPPSRPHTRLQHAPMRSPAGCFSAAASPHPSTGPWLIANKGRHPVRPLTPTCSTRSIYSPARGTSAVPVRHRGLFSTLYTCGVWGGTVWPGGVGLWRELWGCGLLQCGKGKGVGGEGVGRKAFVPLAAHGHPAPGCCSHRPRSHRLRPLPIPPPDPQAGSSPYPFASPAKTSPQAPTPPSSSAPGGCPRKGSGSGWRGCRSPACWCP